MKRIISILLAGLILVLSGCGNTQNSDDGIMLYYSVNNEVETGASVRGEMDTAVEHTVPAVVKRLFDGPYDTTILQQTFPEGTAMLSWSLEGETLLLDLTEAYGRLSGIALTRAQYCIVLTLTQLEGVNDVIITVDGHSLPGVGSDALNADDVILKGETEDPITVSSQLYFPLTDANGLGVEYREFEVADNALLTQANGVLKQLVQGPKEPEMKAFLSNGTLEAIYIVSGVCYVELDNLAMSCICGEDAIIEQNLYAIVDSITELDGIDSVTFMLEGAAIEGWQQSYSAVYEFN